MRRMNPIERRVERFLREPPSVRNAAAVMVIATTVVVISLIDSGAKEQLSDRELMDKRFDDLERKLDVLATERGNSGT